ncbi:hypothetical protein B484DRAFT_218046 [Ochromonadaceae sp. CCMP2298]|nr:hypothetical protein B484DRAFT_218046 [Ochromonadaceae sp. CCMP2298]
MLCQPMLLCLVALVISHVTHVAAYRHIPHIPVQRRHAMAVKSLESVSESVSVASVVETKPKRSLMSVLKKTAKKEKAPKAAAPKASADIVGVGMEVGVEVEKVKKAVKRVKKVVVAEAVEVKVKKAPVKRAKKVVVPVMEVGEGAVEVAGEDLVGGVKAKKPRKAKVVKAEADPLEAFLSFGDEYMASNDVEDRGDSGRARRAERDRDSNGDSDSGFGGGRGGRESSGGRGGRSSGRESLRDVDGMGHDVEDEEVKQILLLVQARCEVNI